MKKTKLITGLLVTVLLTLGLVLPAAAQVEPSEVTADLKPGGSITVIKEVETPEIPPKPDIYFMSDTTGSMGDKIALVSANAGTILSGIISLDPTAQFGVGAYQDFPVPDVAPWAFNNQLDITDDTAAAAAAIAAWPDLGC